MNVQREVVFGCSLESLNTQFGLNQNPSVWTVTVIQDEGQTFSLSGLPKHGVRHIERVQLGALDMYGLVQAWDKREIDVAGTGIYTVRLSDMRTAMDAAQVFLEAPVNANLGSNVIAVTPGASEDLNTGIKYSRIRPLVESTVLQYGQVRFRMDLSAIPITERTIDRERIPYRIRGGAMSLVEMIQQVADDHGFDWFVETTPDDNGIYRVKVWTIDRSANRLTLKALADKHPGAILRLTTGHETRDDVTRTVVLGAQKQTLSKIAASRWKPFWGFTEDGDVLDGPEFRLVSTDGSIRRRKTSYTEMEKALNGELTSTATGQQTHLTDDEISAIRAYANEYWGRQFYCDISSNDIDDYGEPWIDVAQAGWWNSEVNPERLATEHEVKLCTDDGRWVSFAKLKSPGLIGAVWDQSILTRQDFIAEGKSKFYMKVSVERVDLLRNADDDSDLRWRYMSRTRRRKGSILLVTLPTPLEVTMTASTVTGLNREVDETVVTTNGASNSGRVTRMKQLDSVYVPLLDRRQTYGPWTSDAIIPKAFRHDGKTRVVVDTSLAPWTFAWRGIDIHDANMLLNAVATARLRASVIQFMEVDTGELEVAGLPTVNLGTAIGYGTNITSISCSYDTKGLRTLYKCQIYTHELGRYQRYYQELVDKLRRDAQRKQNSQYPQANYWTMGKELNALRKGLGGATSGSGGGDAYGDLSFTAKIISRETDGPFYYVHKYKEVLVNGFVTLRLDSILDTKVTNLAEHPDAPARVPIGTYVRIRPWKTVKLPSTGGTPTVFVEAWVMDERPPAPQSLTMRTIDHGTNDGSGPRYGLELVAGSLDGLSERDVQSYDYIRVRNLGEPAGSAGYLPIGTEVQITWIYDSVSHLYKPIMNQALNIFVAPEV
jgi:hypothetical protein